MFFITLENVLTCTAQISYNRNSISKVWEHLFPLSSSNFAVFRCVTLFSGSHSPLLLTPLSLCSSAKEFRGDTQNVP